jgi:hypothetical protein
MMNASELIQRRRVCTVARSQQCASSSARIQPTSEFRAEELSIEYPCLPAPISAPRILFDTVDVTYTTPDAVTYSVGWGCVPGATHYKVFIRGPAVDNNYINVGVPPTYNNFRTVSAVPSLMFTDTSPLLTTTSYTGTADFTTWPKLNLYVFAYRHGKRSDIPCTQLCLWWNGSDIDASLWPVVTQDFTGGDGFNSVSEPEFDTVTVRNRYTNTVKTITADDPLITDGSGVTVYPENVVGATAIASATF